MILRTLSCDAMNEQELCKKRLLDLSRQAERKYMVTFSHFLNLNEQNIYHSAEQEFATKTLAFGGYHEAERQMVAFIPDALLLWDRTSEDSLREAVCACNFPIRCLLASPRHPKFAQPLTHRDVLGALMHLGIERGKLGDIICMEHAYYIFCEEDIHAFIMDSLTKIKHTDVVLSAVEHTDFSAVSPEFEEHADVIASNRIDCIIARAYHLSRSEAADYLGSERVFIGGRCITNCNQACADGAIVSVRGKGRFVFETGQVLSKKGKLKVIFKLYR